MEKEIVKEYSNDEITIVWKPGLCIHARECVKALPEVYQPDEKPWITVEKATTEQLIDQIGKCPSGALSYYKNESEKTEASSDKEIIKIEALKDGPLLVHGKLNIINDGTRTERDKTTAFCRCGASGNKPFCDGSHKKINFTS